MSGPTVSVVIPSYRAEPFIDETLRSVLSQDFTDFELIVCDDASPDATVAVARRAAGDDPRVRVLAHEDRLGPAGNWNRAVAAARAPYIKVLCSDDVLRPDCLRRQIAALEADPAAGIVAARRDIIDARGKVLFAGRGLQGLRPRMSGADATRAMVRCATTPFGEPSVVTLRRQALDEAGLFSERYGTLIDLDMYARILARWDCVAIDDTLAAFRVRRESWSDLAHGAQGAMVRRLLRDLRHQRAAGVGRRALVEGWVRSYVNQIGRRVAFVLHR
jgi:glycosyltransferase involved in cell wall biosynthesis